MTRLDLLAQPTRRKGEHIRAVIERERQQQIESNLAAADQRAASVRKMSRSLTHLSSSSSTRSPAPLKLHQFGRYTPNGGSASAKMHGNHVGRPLRKSNATKSMTQLVTAKLLSTPKTPTVVQARNAQKHTEIDSRTTNVSSGLCVCLSVTTIVMFFQHQNKKNQIRNKKQNLPKTKTVVPCFSALTLTHSLTHLQLTLFLLFYNINIYTCFYLYGR